MEQASFFKQIVEFNKASFDNSFDTISMIQGQSEMMADTLWNQADQTSQEAKAAVSEWNRMCRESSESLKNAVDEGYQKLFELFGTVAAEKTSKPTQKEKTKPEKTDKLKTK